MVKSIIDIDVNDASFQRFQQLWNQYQQQLRSTPVAWRQIAIAQAQGVKGFRDLVHEQAIALGQQRLMEQAHRAAVVLLREEEGIWRRMQRTTTGVATNIRDITGQLLEWGKVTGIISGLLGAGGLFGVTRLAQEVAGGRRVAMGQGTTYGEQKAFATNFQRLVDPESVLGGVNAALTNVQNRVNLYNAGLREDELGGGSAQVSARLLNRLKGLADQTPDNLLGNVHAARGLGNLGISPEDFQRLKRMSREELGTLTAGFNRDRNGLGVTEANQRAWQDLSTQLTRAAQEIETVLVKGLASAVPEIRKLSEEVVGLVKAFSENGGLLDAVNDLRDVIKGITGLVKDPFGTVKGAVINDWNREVENFRHSPLGRALGAQPATPANPSGSVFGPSEPGTRNIWGGLNVKPGAGSLHSGLLPLARGISENVPGIERFTAGNDEFHKGRPSAHNDDRAFDLTIKDPSKSAEIADLIRKEMVRQGIRGTVIDEYRNPSAGATGGHLHVQTDRKLDVSISNTPGSSIIVQTRQLVPPS